MAIAILFGSSFAKDYSVTVYSRHEEQPLSDVKTTINGTDRITDQTGICSIITNEGSIVKIDAEYEVPGTNIKERQNLKPFKLTADRKVDLNFKYSPQRYNVIATCLKGSAPVEKTLVKVDAADLGGNGILHMQNYTDPNGQCRFTLPGNISYKITAYASQSTPPVSFMQTKLVPKLNSDTEILFKAQ